VQHVTHVEGQIDASSHIAGFRVCTVKEQLKTSSDRQIIGLF